ncbi:hypothetical protein NQ318_015594 [Aromia moschata]|uniref:Uncharacterized protein n=1 Tax=Aromia moschata TaxID=1265417 RepID=A0AAV8X4A2_9CUCU|nr:hypothetical protein NQ318_015594 [Aromia moschata]
MLSLGFSRSLNTILMLKKFSNIPGGHGSLVVQVVSWRFTRVFNKFFVYNNNRVESATSKTPEKTFWFNFQGNFEENLWMTLKIRTSWSPVSKTVLHKPASDIIKRIPLSNNTVQRCIDEMSIKLKVSCAIFLQTIYFSIQLDESTLPGNEALLLAYDPKIHEELLFARTLTTDTKDESIFNVFKDYFMEKAIFIKYNISSFGWGTCHGWALPWICKPLKTKYTRGVSNTVLVTQWRYPSTIFSCQKSEC